MKEDDHIQYRADWQDMIPYAEGSRDPEPGRTVGILGFIQGAQDGCNYNKKGDKKMKDVRITPAINGWVVYVGCEKLVFENKSNMLLEIDNYIAKPREMEKKYLQSRKNELEVGPTLPEVGELRTPSEDTYPDDTVKIEPA